MRGFAWDVFGDGKTSLRGGYGESYTRIFTNQDCSFSCDANPPVFTNQTLSNLVFPSTTTWNVAGAGGVAANTESAADTHRDGPEHPGLAGGQLLAGSAAPVPGQLCRLRGGSRKPHPASGGHMELSTSRRPW